MVVARSTQESAMKWLRDQNVSYRLVLDFDLELYRQLGLRRSVKLVWSMESIVLYAQFRVAGVSPSPSYEGDDLQVMGGDFITDTSGKLIYAYPSKQPSDRPIVEHILTVLDSAF